MKRLFDICASLLLLALASPVLALIAFLILLRDGRPVVFLQTRIGQHGREFRIMKFRSMVNNAEKIGGYSTAECDPRITAIGRFIRRTSLDELPQLINVVRGDMSLVGPRPEVPAQRANYSEQDWHLRCSVRPGITGLAQATLRSYATPEQRLALDLAYVRHHGVWRDATIIGQTALQVFGKGGN